MATTSRRRALARRRRARAALDQWREFDDQEFIPPGVRRLDVPMPLLGRESLDALRDMLHGHLEELAYLWERRN